MSWKKVTQLDVPEFVMAAVVGVLHTLDARVGGAGLGVLQLVLLQPQLPCYKLRLA